MTETNAYGQPVGALVPDWTVPAVPAHAPLEGRVTRLEPLDPARHGDDMAVIGHGAAGVVLGAGTGIGVHVLLDDTVLAQRAGDGKSEGRGFDLRGCRAGGESDKGGNNELFHAANIGRRRPRLKLCQKFFASRSAS